MAKKIRTFVAIPLPAAIQKTLAGFIRELSPLTENVRWVEQNLLHLTLVFVGDIEDVRVHEVCTAVKQVCSQTEQIPITVAGVGFFPKLKKPQVIWAGIDEGSQQVIELREALAEKLDESRFRFDWKFRAHITLGRMNRGRFEDQALVEKAREHAERDFGELLVDKVVAFSSTLEKSGPVYVSLATVRLTG